MKVTKKEKKSGLNSSFTSDFLEPGVPGWIHAAQIVQAVCRSHQSVDLTLPPLELSQVVEASHDGCDGLLDQ